MKKLFILIPILHLSIAETIISVKSPPTKKQLESASQILTEAAALDTLSLSRFKKIIKARKLTEDRNAAEKFQAELVCDGTTQFKEEDQSGTPSDCCYKGEASEAKRLVIAAESRGGFWDWEESTLRSVTVSGVASGETLKLVILDMPNNVESEIIARKCPAR